jgi:spermidine synthase
VGLVGLGTGAMAAYGAPGRVFTFFEIDPAVVRIAEDPAMFTYLADSEAEVEMRLGDGRLSLAAEPDGRFGLLVLDAFSSDAIPVHLLTVEALRLDLAKMRPDGLLAFHISNRHLNLTPVLAAAAEELGLVAMRQIDLVTADEGDEGRVSSTWVVLGRDMAALKPIARDGRWEVLRRRPGFRAWTDDYSNIWSILEWD